MRNASKIERSWCGLLLHPRLKRLAPLAALRLARSLAPPAQLAVLALGTVWLKKP